MARASDKINLLSIEQCALSYNTRMGRKNGAGG